MPKDSDAKAILAYLPKMPETTLLLFLLRGEADMKLAFPKALAKEDRVVAFTELSESEAARWAGQLARRRGVTILPENARFLSPLQERIAHALRANLKSLPAMWAMETKLPGRPFPR